MTRWPPTATLLISALAAACSGEDTEAPPPSIPLEDLAAEAAPAYVQGYLDCLGPLAESLSQILHGEDLALRTERGLQDEFALLADAVEAGRVTYHADLMPACVTAAEARTCDQLLERDIPECEAAVEGTMATGGACTSDWECEGTNVCKFEASCPGACQPRGAAGTACLRNDECDDGLVCFVTTSAATPTGLCTQPRGAAEPCGGAGAEPECTPGLLCVGDDKAAHVAGTCRAFSEIFVGGAGQSCTFESLCEPGLSCTVLAITPALDAECAPPVASGASCRIGIPEQCPVGQYCGDLDAALEGSCLPLPGEGEPCARPNEAEPLCDAYLRCDAGTCRAIQRLGGTCSSNALCYSENCVAGRCQSKSVCSP